MRHDAKIWNSVEVKPGENLWEDIDGDVFEIMAEIDLDKSKEIVLDIRGEKIVYNVKDQLLKVMDSEATVLPIDDKIKLRLIVDRNSIEIYANQGDVTFTRFFYPDPSNMNLSLTSTGGRFTIQTMEVYRLRSIWLKREQELGYQREELKYMKPE